MILSGDSVIVLSLLLFNMFNINKLLCWNELLTCDLLKTMCLRHNIFRSIPQFGYVLLSVYMWTNRFLWLSKLARTKSFPLCLSETCRWRLNEHAQFPLGTWNKLGVLACSMSSVMSWWHVWLLRDLWSPNLCNVIFQWETCIDSQLQLVPASTALLSRTR